MEGDSLPIDFLRHIVAYLERYRHFPAIFADYAFYFVDRYLLGTGPAVLPQLTLSSPLFQPHHIKLGKQRRRAVRSKILHHRYDDLFLPADVLTVSGTLVDWCHIVNLLRLRGRVDVTATGSIK